MRERKWQRKISNAKITQEAFITTWAQPLHCNLRRAHTHSGKTSKTIKNLRAQLPQQDALTKPPQ
jgi:hypothetical protein